MGQKFKKKLKNEDAPKSEDLKNKCDFKIDYDHEDDPKNGSTSEIQTLLYGIFSRIDVFAKKFGKRNYDCCLKKLWLSSEIYQLSSYRHF